MKRNIVLHISYDGTAYFGWQKTEAGPSIESVLEKAIETILNHPIYLQAASRTDAGVHAEGQIVNFFTGHSILCDKLRLGINALLSKDIRVNGVIEVKDSFHPTLDCSGKEYHYRLCYGEIQSPLQRFYEWHTVYPIDLNLMNQAAKLLTGTHDFEAFCNVRRNISYTSYVRTVSNIEIVKLSESQLLIKIRGQNFLYKMVRNIVGTLAYIGQGKLLLEDIPAMLNSRDRKKIGIAAPAHGLNLFKVFYPYLECCDLSQLS